MMEAKKGLLLSQGTPRLLLGQMNVYVYVCITSFSSCLTAVSTVDPSFLFHPIQNYGAE